MTIPSQEDFRWFIEEFDNWPRLADSQRWYDIQWFIIDGANAVVPQEEVDKATWLVEFANYVANMTDEEYILWKLKQ